MSIDNYTNPENMENYDKSEEAIPKKKSCKKVVCIVLIIVIVLGIFAIVIFRDKISELFDNTFSEAYKPIVYLYPEQESDITVKLGYHELIKVSYPEYSQGWNVIGKPSGDLIDKNNGKSLYALYYESKNNYSFNIEKDGFIVDANNIITFLEEKLDILGLNERETEEFIIYWLPILKENKYTYIRFAEKEEIEKNMPLEIYPKPDTVIRVLMTYKGIDEPFEIQEQQLKKVDRTGFVAVEWGGTLIK